MDATKLVAGEILGYNGKTVIVNSRVYTIDSPTIKKLCGAAYYLSSNKDCNSLSEMLSSLAKSEQLCRALSWLINGDESLAEELSEGTLDEIVEALCVGFELISLENFLKLSSLAKSAASLTANPKQSETTA